MTTLWHPLFADLQALCPPPGGPPIRPLQYPPPLPPPPHPRRYVATNVIGMRDAAAHTRPSLLADAFEALLGALYLDAGLPAVRAFLLRVFATCVDWAALEAERDWKSALVARAAQYGWDACRRAACAPASAALRARAHARWILRAWSHARPALPLCPALPACPSPSTAAARLTKRCRVVCCASAGVWTAS